MKRAALSLFLAIATVHTVSADRGPWLFLGHSPISGIGGLPTLLLHKSDLTLVGSFTLPCRSDNTSGSCQPGIFDGVYHFGAVAYNQSHDSLFTVGFTKGTIGEVTIPTPLQTGSVSGLNRAAYVQTLQEATNGLIYATELETATAAHVGGLLVDGSKLYGTVYSTYDGDGTQSHSHYYQDLTLNSNIHGPFVLSGTAFTGQSIVGYTSAYLAAVPAVWQAALGGPHLTGNACISIISRTSAGPGVWSTNLASLATLGNSTPAYQLLGYDGGVSPNTHFLDAPWGDTSGVHFVYNGTCGITGVIFPEGTASVLFFGKIGESNYCYGQGTTDPALDQMPTGMGDIFCYDPDSNEKGDHTYGGHYVYRVWAYDAHGFAAVKAGTLHPYDLLPYDYWNMDLPYQCCQAEIIGAGYDPVHKRMFLGQQLVEGDDKPIVNVFTHP